MREDWDSFFISLAKLMSARSRDPSTKTGCVIVDSSNCILSSGYNGFPRGVKDNEERYLNRDVKYRLVAHADLNAIYSAARNGIKLAGSTMYLTGPPCNECTKGIIQSGIVRVVWPKDNSFENDPATRARWEESLEATFLMACEAGIEMNRV
jgi:dCMP deaminase